MDERKSLEQWVAELSERDLPLLQQSCKDLKQIGSYETVSMAKFSNIVLTDPGLTLTILRAGCAMPRSRSMSVCRRAITGARLSGITP